MAFAIGKRVGNAVARNRVRRRLRELALRRMDLPSGMYLVRVGPSAANLDFETLGKHLVRAAKGLAASHRASQERRPLPR